MTDVAGMLSQGPPDPTDPGGDLARRISFRHPGMPAFFPAVAGSGRNLVSPDAWTAYLQSLIGPAFRSAGVATPVPADDRTTLAKEPGVMP